MTDALIKESKIMNLISDAVLAEREACAKAAEDENATFAHEIAAAIRARTATQAKGKPEHPTVHDFYDASEREKAAAHTESTLINDIALMFFDNQTVKPVPSDYARAVIARVRAAPQPPASPSQEGEDGKRVAKAIADERCDNVMEDDRSNCIDSGSCHCLDYARIAIAAIASPSQEGRMREALEQVRKALRPFEWASQYVDRRLVGEPMVTQFKDALGKLTIGDFNELARACTQIDAALAHDDGGKEPK